MLKYVGHDTHCFIFFLCFGQLSNWLFWDNKDVSWGLRSNIGEGNTLEKKEDIKQVLSWSDNCKFHFYVDK